MPFSPDTDASRHAEAVRRQTLCHAAAALMQSGLSQNEAARAIGEARANLSRYLRAFRAGGYPALLPGVSSGRRSVREKLAGEIGAKALAAFENKVIGHGLDMDGSDGAAWRKLARCADAPAAVREYIAKVENRHASKHAIARSLRRATRITPGMMLAHQGARALALRGAWTPRYCDIFPGDIFGPDDTTPIWGYYTEVEPCEKYPRGQKVGQGQFLPMLDVASQSIVSFALILRETSAYRASDVWRLIGHTHNTVGVPRLGYQMERGSWEAGLIRGAEVMVGEGDFAHERRVGGLRMLRTNLLPLHIERMNGAGPTHLQTWTSYLPKSKSIEGAFHRLQRFEGVLWGGLGRDQMRRPFEKAKKIFEACKRGSASAPLHFLSLAEISRKLMAVIDEYHAEPIQGEVFRGRPREVFEAGIAAHGELLPPPVESGYLYRSDWACVTISRGLARIRQQNHELGRQVSYYYEAPELFARRDVDGKQVLLYWDRDAFETPADVVSQEGEWLGQAHYYQRPGMFLDGDVSGHEARRASREAVTAMFSFSHRPEAIQQIKLAATADGLLDSVTHTAIEETSRHEEYLETVVNWSGLLYTCPKVSLVHKLVNLDVASPADMRAPGAVTGIFAFESAIDELAYQAGMDPLEFRRKNYAEKDQNVDKLFSSKELRACYDQASERFGWAGRPLEPRSMRRGSDLIGWGVSTGCWEAMQMKAEVKAVLKADGKLTVSSATSDIGTGTYTVMTMIAAEFSGVAMETRTRKLSTSSPAPIWWPRAA